MPYKYSILNIYLYGFVQIKFRYNIQHSSCIKLTISYKNIFNKFKLNFRAEKMFLTKHFLQQIIQANQASPKMAGQLFTYNPKTKQFETLTRNSASTGYRSRCFLLFLLSVTALARICILKLNSYSKNETTIIVEINLCAMMLLVLYSCWGGI